MELKRQTSILKEQNAKLENKLLKVGQQNTELKNLLQMAVKSDTKKDSLIEELKVQFEHERKRIAERIAQIESEKQSIDSYKKELKEDSLQHAEKLSGLEYQHRELQSRLRQV